MLLDIKDLAHSVVGAPQYHDHVVGSDYSIHQKSTLIDKQKLANAVQKEKQQMCPWSSPPSNPFI